MDQRDQQLRVPIQIKNLNNRIFQTHPVISKVQDKLIQLGEGDLAVELADTWYDTMDGLYGLHWAYSEEEMRT